MDLVLWLLVVQGVIGAFDNFWHHEITEALPSKPSARGELALHTVREFLYGIIFLALGWSEWHGAWAAVLAAMLVTEVVVTLWDFIVEDLTRKLPPLERVLHTLLAMNYGAVLVVLIPILWGWGIAPTAIVPADHGVLSWIMTLYAVGILVWSLRDAIAVARLTPLQKPEWSRRPFLVAENADPRTVLVTGATGFIGGALCRRLIERGDEVIVLTRDRARAEYRFGDHASIVENLDELADATRIDAVVNLAGAPVLGLPWTTSRRAEIMASRVATTQQVIALIERLEHRPAALINASAVGYYGLSADAVCGEDAPPQAIFMSELCQAWEASASKAEALGVRVCIMRLGLVLGRAGGTLPALALPVRSGAGAVMGSGRQWMSWVHIDDVTRFVEESLADPARDGVYNMTAPEPARHRQFMASLGSVLRRPVWFRIPAWPMRFMMGEMSQLLLDGQRTTSVKAVGAGFTFAHRDLEGALRDLLAPAEEEVTVVYNASCPVCEAEISRYRRKAAASGAPLGFTDIGAQPNRLVHRGVSDDELRRRLHVTDSQGRLLSGVDAFLAIWRRLPGYRWLAAVVALPGPRHLFSAAYEWLAVPLLAQWNSRRIRHNHQ